MYFQLFLFKYLHAYEINPFFLSGHLVSRQGAFPRKMHSRGHPNAKVLPKDGLLTSPSTNHAANMPASQAESEYARTEDGLGSMRQFCEPLLRGKMLPPGSFPGLIGCLCVQDLLRIRHPVWIIGVP
jgi:hypothetical protein